ncbi:hypothetical protein [Amycolatopsis sp. NPDC059021]|uniref:hypothetical protein n=1 Tax=Amycolatopsis sp. NPDC059021 TaxID=3346704 RepID=UPI00366F7680
MTERTSLSLAVDVDLDTVIASIHGTESWKREFAAADDARRAELVARLRVRSRRALEDALHLLAFTGDPATAETPGREAAPQAP